MHRSGTSLITHWLNECGLQLGEDFLGAGLGNDDGHYEDVEFLKLHEEILEANNLPTTGLMEDYDINVSAYHKEKLRKIINDKNRKYDQWGWKDPRTCLFLDVYKELIPDARYLVILRDYKDVVSSLLYRDFRDYEKKYLQRGSFDRFIWKAFRRKGRLKKFYQEKADHYLKIWIAYNEHILKSVESLPRHAYVVLNYTQLKKNDATICSFLNQRWNLSLKYFNFKKIYKEKMISKHIDTDIYVADRSLISKASMLQKNLESYMVLM